MTPAWMLGLLALAPYHDDSMSLSRVRVGTESVEVELRIQALSVVEVLPWLDRDRDALLSPEELEGEVELGRYVLEHFRLFGNEGALRPADFPIAQVDPTGMIPGSWVQLEWTLETERLDELRLEVDLFADTSPGHLEFTEVHWEGVELPGLVLGPGSDSWEFMAPTPLERVTETGGELPGRPLALACLLFLLVLGAGTLTELRLGSLTFALGSGAVALGVSLPSGTATTGVELTALLAAAYLGAERSLMRREKPLTFEAALLGLICGLAMAGEATRLSEGKLHVPITQLSDAGIVLLVGGLVALGARRLERPRWVGGLTLALGLALFGSDVFAL